MIAAMLKAKGEQYIQRLRNQRDSLHAISARALADLVAAGEVELSPTISRKHAAEVRRNGGPIGWAPMELVPANAGGVAIVANAPHPHAALLLADFVLGRRVRKFTAISTSPARPKIWASSASTRKTVSPVSSTTRSSNAGSNFCATTDENDVHRIETTYREKS